MKPEIKSFLQKFFFSGILYASMMAGFRYFEGDSFNIWRFVFDGTFFGGFMGGVSVYERKRNSKK